MADEGSLRLTVYAVKYQIESYSQQHPNDFGASDGRDRIPMKKLMKIFEIKKKSSMERQNLFREIVNDICELEMLEGVGKVLVLRDDIEFPDKDADEDDNVADLGYAEHMPSVCSDHERRNGDTIDKSGALSVATADSVGVYEEGEDGKGEKVRRKGYKRRGSVTRYSIVAQDAVLDEYKKHEDVINQFRRDSIKFENKMSNMTINDNNSTADSSKGSRAPPRTTTGRRGQQQQPEVDENGNAVQRFFRRGRFSLAF